MTAPIIVWLRRDLRLADHPALAAACATGRPVLPVFIFTSDGRPLGAASRWWLHHSLTAHTVALATLGLRLILRRGKPPAVLTQLVQATGATEVHVLRGTEPADVAAEDEVKAALQGHAELRRHAADLLWPAGSLLTAGGGSFRVFTPFWRAGLAAPAPRVPVALPAAPPPAAPAVASEELASWDLLPSRPDWAGGLRAHWQPGESAAGTRLAHFVNGPLADYAGGRNRPDQPLTSRLSPHLHFGEVSPRQVWYATEGHAGAEPYRRELAWREFSVNLLLQLPDLATEPLRPEFRRFPWRDDPAGLKAWQRGRTGYPLVDAGMRELWHTGWMHNRVRMVVASFLVKHLLIAWQAGEQWFWDTLVDADAANNAASWQWVAGCGADAAPYFRVFNPVLQGQKFDPAGDYVRRWVPELARVPAQWIHAPWTATPLELAAAGVVLGKDYPLPIVDHALARQRALAAYASLKA
jgi:deoxyribodipyrimidine photo-lyase